MLVAIGSYAKMQLSPFAWNVLWNMNNKNYFINVLYFHAPPFHFMDNKALYSFDPPMQTTI